MKYFAYGSNMLAARLRSRAPSAAAAGVGTLRGYRLRFDKRGRDGSGKCNLEESPAPADRVYGVIFCIDAADLCALDAAEDVPRGGYSRQSIRVRTPGGEAPVECYFASPSFIETGLRPFDWYRALVVAGALEHGIPGDYCNALASLPATRDPDEKRRQRALAMLGRLASDAENGRQPHPRD